MANLVSNEVKDGVARLVLSNPAKRNALGRETIAALKAAAEELAADDSLRVVILAAEGPVFAAGADVRVLANLKPGEARDFITSLYEAIEAVRQIPVPVIARLQGHCLGAAVELAAACDMRVGDTTTVIGMPEVAVGIPSVIQAALLPGLIGQGRTREMLLTARAYDAGAALAMGFLEEVVTPAQLDSAVQMRVEQVLSNTPLAVRAQKALLNRWQQVPLDEAIALSIEAFDRAYGTGEAATRLAAHVKGKGEND